MRSCLLDFKKRGEETFLVLLAHRRGKTACPHRWGHDALQVWALPCRVAFEKSAALCTCRTVSWNGLLTLLPRPVSMPLSPELRHRRAAAGQARRQRPTRAVQPTQMGRAPHRPAFGTAWLAAQRQQRAAAQLAAAALAALRPGPTRQGAATLVQHRGQRAALPRGAPVRRPGCTAALPPSSWQRSRHTLLHQRSQCLARSPTPSTCRCIRQGHLISRSPPQSQRRLPRRSPLVAHKRPEKQQMHTLGSRTMSIPPSKRRMARQRQQRRPAHRERRLRRLPPRPPRPLLLQPLHWWTRSLPRPQCTTHGTAAPLLPSGRNSRSMSGRSLRQLLGRAAWPLRPAPCQNRLQSRPRRQ